MRLLLRTRESFVSVDVRAEVGREFLRTVFAAPFFSRESEVEAAWRFAFEEEPISHFHSLLALSDAEICAMIPDGYE